MTSSTDITTPEAPGTFTYRPHPHIAKRQEKGAPTTKEARSSLHGSSLLGRINEKVGMGITVAVGTMWCAYIFAVIALISLPSTLSSGSLFQIVVWISSSFLQLVLLPVIIVGQNIQAKAADARAEATYNDASAVLEEAKSIQEHLGAQDAQIAAIVTQLQGLLDAKKNS